MLFRSDPALIWPKESSSGIEPGLYRFEKFVHTCTVFECIHVLLSYNMLVL